MIFNRSFWRELRSKPFRSAMVAEQAKRAIPHQLRAIMKRRGLTQEKLAKASGLTQGAISRAVDPDYGNLSINTIVRVAAGLDVAFVGRFVPFSHLDEYYRSMGDDEYGNVPTFPEEDKALSIESPLSLVQQRQSTIRSVQLKIPYDLPTFVVVADNDEEPDHWFHKINPDEKSSRFAATA